MRAGDRVLASQHVGGRSRVTELPCFHYIPCCLEVIPDSRELGTTVSANAKY